MAAVSMKPKTRLGVKRVTRDNVIEEMRTLSATSVYETLVGLWAKERAAIIARGKKDRTNETAARESWARLDGFEMAAEMVEKWAQQQTSLEKKAIPNPVEEEK